MVELVGKYGAKKWSSIANELKGRIGKQCRYIICYFFKVCMQANSMLHFFEIDADTRE